MRARERQARKPAAHCAAGLRFPAGCAPASPWAPALLRPAPGTNYVAHAGLPLQGLHHPLLFLWVEPKGKPWKRVEDRYEFPAWASWWQQGCWAGGNVTAVENSKWLREKWAVLSLILVTEKQEGICEMSLAKFSFPDFSWVACGTSWELEIGWNKVFQ